MRSENFVKKISNNDKQTISRTIAFIESGNSNSTDLLKDLHKKIGNAYRFYITGPPRTGKSTLTNQLTKFYRKQNKKVGIIAVDPTSPFTGGAQASSVLLDIRLQQMEKSGEEFTKEQKEKLLIEIIQSYKVTSNPLHGEARLWSDEIIDPPLTKEYIPYSIECANNNPNIPCFNSFIIQT